MASADVVLAVHTDQHEVHGPARVGIDESESIHHPRGVDQGRQRQQHLSEALRRGGPIVTDQDRCHRAAASQQADLGDESPSNRRSQ